MVTGGGQLREIMKVAAENWERVFKHASGNWKLTVEYGWGNLHGQFYGKEFAISERGNNPPHIGHSCVLFNADATLDDPVKGFFADPTPSDNSEYLAYTADTINTDYGWLNVARTFSEPTGEAVNRVDMLMLAMHTMLGKNKKAALWMTMGAILFVVSDSLLAFNKFFSPFNNAGVIIMLTYGLAQLFITEGAVRYINSETLNKV